MAPRRNSRYANTSAVQDASGHLALTDRERYLHRVLPDNIEHRVTEGDTLQSIAATYYAAIGRPPTFSAAELWWVIADFQPDPILDPTIVLEPGRIVVVPSVRTVLEEIL